ncbi:MAG: ATP-dependent Clp protease ATP-binding subunit ClpA [bacterium]
MFSSKIESIVEYAAQEAKKRHHEYLCLEHILYAILNDREGITIIANCGGDVKRIKARLENFFKKHCPSLNENYKLDDTYHQPLKTIAISRVFQRTIMHVRNSGKKKAEIGDILAAILEEKTSYAAYFLNQEGISRLDILEYISHGISKTAPAGEESKRPSNDPLVDFTTNFTQRAAEGKIDPLIGREEEIERTMQILCRRRKNNPVFVGEPGVGKTAIAEGLAIKICQNKVPALIAHSEIFCLDMGSLLAGTRFRGDFEQRLKAVIEAIKKRPKAILFIDEIHTIVGAGATSDGTLDASNILKPSLASENFRCIGSTTYNEYKNHFEKDHALSRRFQMVEIKEPSVEETIKILQGLSVHYEKYHGIRFSKDSLKAAAELSAKYINDRFLPDKAIDVIDEAGAFCNLFPSFKKEKIINVKDIEDIVSKIARVPVKSASSEDRKSLKNLEHDLKQQVFGQDTALHSLAVAIKRSHSGLGHPHQPIGSFLFTGPTGVGKTEVSKQLASILGISFIRFDMSEYMEKHTVARLIGAPPGYVGFDQGGLLTDAIRKKPYSVLLLDEIEKAHPDIFNILLQIMDNATLTDNNGRRADFRKVIVIMTSNAGSKEMEMKPIGFGNPELGKGKEAIDKLFSPEFRNRLDDIIEFKSLSMENIIKIVDKFIKEMADQLKDKKITITISKKAQIWLARKGYNPTYGARPMTRLIQSDIKNPLADEILFGRLKKGGQVTIKVQGDKLAFMIKPALR